jgi:enolase-phosphatase E1
MTRLRAIVLDVEGTTTPIDFVHQGLFPYARARIGQHLRDHVGDAEVRNAIRELRTQRDADESEGQDVPPWDDRDPARAVQSATSYCLSLIAADRKVPALKALQGRVWQAGYERGELLGEVYPDVPGALARWSEDGLRIAIFSSGSVLSQRLLFAHSTHGDLGASIDEYFDTRTGPKRETESYRRIAAMLEVQPSALLFISDTREELDAAAAAGMRTTLCARSGAPAPGTAHPVVADFDELRRIIAAPHDGRALA